MKKIITVFLFGITIFITSPDYVKAQFANKSLTNSRFKNTAALFTYANENSEVEKDKPGAGEESLKAHELSLKAAKANLKALKAKVKATTNFEKQFKDATDAEWYEGQNAIVASFTRSEVKTISVYNTKGIWVHTLKYFPAEKTPKEIRSIIDRNYPNADINLTIDVKEGEIKFYIVQIEDKKSYKKIVVYNDEIELIEQLKKS